MMTVEQYREANNAIEQMEAAWVAFGKRKADEMRLEDQRPLIKAAAVLRILEAKRATSATAAEKIVETDTEYLEHRAKQRDAVIATQRAYGQAKAATMRAQMLAQNDD